MLRIAVIAACLLAAIAFFTRSPRGQQAVVGILALMILYIVLKLSGVIDAIEPGRVGTP